MDKYMEGYKNRKGRYEQYSIIENIISENIISGKYVDNAFSLDRLDSECKHCFVIVTKTGSHIVFNSISEFTNWING